MELNKIKKMAQDLLLQNDLSVFVGEEKILTILQEIVDEKIDPGDIDITLKTLINIDRYLYTKSKMQVSDKDFEYLKNIAEILRNQKIRIEDSVAFESPIFKVSIDKNDKEKYFYFVTREGAEKYIETHSTQLKHLPKHKENVAPGERRKSTLFNIETNKNLEIERIIEIIKRNF